MSNAIKIPAAGTNQSRRLTAIRKAIKSGQCEVIGQTTTAHRWGDADGTVMDIVQDNYWQQVYHVPEGKL